MIRALVAAVALCGCKSKSPVPADEAPILDDAPAPLGGERCAAAIPAPASRSTVPVAFVLGAGVSTADAIAAVRPAQRYLAERGIDLIAAPRPVARIADRYLLGGTIDGLKKRLAAAQITSADRVAATAAVKKLVVDEVGSPLAALLEKRARPADSIDVVLVERIASPVSPVQMVLSDLAGLTLSPLLSPEGHSSAELARALRIPDQVPTVLIATRELGRLPPGAARTLVAHEIGHALGLPHVANPENLMDRNRDHRCVPGLDSGQLETLGLGAAKITSRDREETER